MHNAHVNVECECRLAGVQGICAVFESKHTHKNTLHSSFNSGNGESRRSRLKNYAQFVLFNVHMVHGAC